ncbi:MAG: SUMF1/EgtB/PvdO family nonheme iron enzyme [Nitrospirota bacterium]
MIPFIALITYYSFINFNFSNDAIEDSKFNDTRRKDSSLRVKADKVVLEYYYGQPKNALIMAQEIVNEFPGNIFAKRLIGDIDDYFTRLTVFKNDMILIKGYGKYFWIDTKEVTVGRYKRFIKTAFGKKYYLYKIDPPDLYSNLGYADQPVKLRTLSDGYDFCYWEGKRLPKPAEWGMAMRYLSDGSYGQHRISKETGLQFKFLLDKPLVYGLYQMTDRRMYIVNKADKRYENYNIGLRCVSD